ncbi:divalent metal cation transporter [bacterium]|nr:divalent metal cation transporter [bacterium]
MEELEKSIEKTLEQPVKWSRIRRFFKRLGPGLVTGAADDDPSGIGTYSQTGAQFGYHLVWMMPFMLPLMTAVQEMAGRIGLVTGKGLAQVIKENYNRWFLYIAVFCLVFANVVNIGVNIGAMAASARLIVDLPFVWLTLFFTVAIVILELVIPYKRYAKVLKWLCLSLFAYVVTVFLVAVPWPEVFGHVVWPHFELNKEFVMAMVALLGTTISPYLFFWEPSQIVEEEIEHRWTGITTDEVKLSPGKVRRFRVDNFTGMFISQMIAFFILVTAAATLHASGITSIETADQAAKALEPLVTAFPNSGQFASWIFAIGIIGTGLLAVPVLAGSAAYAVSEAVGAKEGLFRKVKRAPVFYGVIALATLMGLLINFVGIPPITALYLSAVINGVMAVPLIFIILKVGSNKKIMKDYVNGPWSKTITTIALVVMLTAALLMFVLR